MIIANLGEAVHERKERFMRIFINPGHALGGDPDPGCINPALADVINGFWEDMKKDPCRRQQAQVRPQG